MTFYEAIIFRSPADIVREAEYLLKEKNTNYIVFEDTNFFAKPYDELMEFSKLMLMHCKGLRWGCMGRLDSILPEWPATRENESRARSLLSTMREGGCHLICLGVESGDETLRSELGRTFVNEWAECVFQLIIESRILATAFLMLGYPKESYTSLKNTYELSMRLKAIRLRISYFYPFGNTNILKNGDIQWIDPKFAGHEYATTEIPTVRCGVAVNDLIEFKERLLRNFYTSKNYIDRLHDISSWSKYWASTMIDWQEKLQKTGYGNVCVRVPSQKMSL